MGGLLVWYSDEEPNCRSRFYCTKCNCHPLGDVITKNHDMIFTGVHYCRINGQQVVKEFWWTAASQGRIFHGEQYHVTTFSVPHSFLRPAQVYRPIGISIGSTAFAGLINVTNRQTHTHTGRSRFSVYSNRLHLVTASKVKGVYYARFACLIVIRQVKQWIYFLRCLLSLWLQLMFCYVNTSRCPITCWLQNRKTFLFSVKINIFLKSTKSIGFKTSTLVYMSMKRQYLYLFATYLFHERWNEINTFAWCRRIKGPAQTNLTASAAAMQVNNYFCDRPRILKMRMWIRGLVPSSQ